MQTLTKKDLYTFINSHQSHSSILVLIYACLCYLSCKSSNPPLFKRETIHWTTVYQNLMAINNIQIHIFKNSYTCNKRLQYVVNIYMSGTCFWPFIYVVRYTCYKKNLICFLQILINTYEKNAKSCYIIE